MKNVCCWGTFDLLHDGHKEFFKDAKNKGDFLYVLVVPDQAVYENKKKYPVNNQRKRADDIMNTGLVNAVIQLELGKSLEAVAKIAPDVFVFGHDQQTPWEENLKKYLAERRITPDYYVSSKFASGISTTQIRKEFGI